MITSECLAAIDLTEFCRQVTELQGSAIKTAVRSRTRPSVIEHQARAHGYMVALASVTQKQAGSFNNGQGCTKAASTVSKNLFWLRLQVKEAVAIYRKLFAGNVRQ
eukprot:581874-Amphidinium_carterae.1